MFHNGHRSALPAGLKPILLSRMGLRHIAALVFGLLLAHVGAAQPSCPLPIPIAPTSITVSPATATGSPTIVATIGLTDPCNVGGSIGLVVSGPRGFNGIVGVQDFAPGAGSGTFFFTLRL
jgi:hypothetical protein